MTDKVRIILLIFIIINQCYITKEKVEEIESTGLFSLVVLSFPLTPSDYWKNNWRLQDDYLHVVHMN